MNRKRNLAPLKMIANKIYKIQAAINKWNQLLICVKDSDVLDLFKHDHFAVICSLYVYGKCHSNVLDRFITAPPPLYQHGLTLIPAWISNYTHYIVWDEITYPFLNFNGATAEV